MPIAPITTTVTVAKQPLLQIQNIPILLTYPTLLLSASLVIEHSLLQATTTISNEPQSNGNNWTRIFLSLLITPMFLGSCLSILNTFVRNLTMDSTEVSITTTSTATEEKILDYSSGSHSHEHSHEHSHSHNETVNDGESNNGSTSSMIGQIKPLMTLFVLFAATWLLDPIRTVSLTLILIQTPASSSTPQILIVALFFAFDLVELIIRSGFTLNLEGLEGVNYGGWLILGYALCYLIRGSLSSIFQGTTTNRSRKMLHYNQWYKELVLPFSLSLGSGFILLCFVKYVNVSMILITLGCGLILQLSQTEALEIQFNSANIIISSLLSYILEILSFKKQFHLVLTIVEVLVICLIYFVPFETATTAISATKAHHTSPSLITELLTHPKTKPIFSFLLLNTTFMLVQLVYSFRSQSLGLLSDSLHMALDSTSLFLGLIATVMASKPPSRSFPFGLRKVETLAGFANGVLLIGIVFGILVEAVQRLVWPVEIQRTGELLIVAALGLVVNIVGIFAFNHGHGDDGHGHGHSHSHGGGGGNDHDDDNENMRGIFLHILADTLGSLGVVVSTVLIQIFETPIFDPISSLFIAIMIFVSAMPLVRSSAGRLLLNLNDKEDDQIKDLLSQVMNMPGVVSYTTPRFWNETNVLEDGLTGGAESHSVQMKSTADLDQSKQRSRGETFSFAFPAPAENALDINDQDHGHSNSHSHSHSNSHSHGHSHSTGMTPPTSSCDGLEDIEQKFKMIGFIHIQHLEGENSTIIKKRVEKVFENAKIKCLVQVENESESCWCRDKI